MIFNHTENPENERELLIAFRSDSGDTELVSGWYDLHEEEYYDHSGENIDRSYLVGWIDKPEIAFK
jgi:hypothetical protein